MSSPSVIQQEFRVGVPVVVTSESPSNDFGAVFEDDGRAGYFYALLLSPEGQLTADALHIYSADQVLDRERSSLLSITWMANGAGVVLRINDYPHALFDFRAQRGYCRTGFPTSSIGDTWPRHTHEWSERALDALHRLAH